MLFVNSAQLQNISDAAGTAFLARSAEMLATPDTSITQNVADIKQITGANNYTSIVPYYHPDPNSASGFPYIRRDGVRNPEAAQTSDSRYVYTMLYAVQSLVIAHQLTGDDSYLASIHIIQQTLLGIMAPLVPSFKHLLYLLCHPYVVRFDVVSLGKNAVDETLSAPEYSHAPSLHVQCHTLYLWARAAVPILRCVSTSHRCTRRVADRVMARASMPARLAHA
jgi:hypothetical protein